jgi:hypothetical protein
MTATDCSKRKITAGAEERIAAAGMRNWPVKVAVNRTPTAFGITSTHHRIDGADLAFMIVGAPVRIDDELIETPDGIIRAIGVATAILETVEDVRIRKVA